MASVTQRIKQYNSSPGKPRGGLVNPKLMTCTQRDDGVGALEGALESINPTIMGLVVDYLVRLQRFEFAQDPRESHDNLWKQALPVSVLGLQRYCEAHHTEAPYDTAIELEDQLTFIPIAGTERRILSIDHHAVVFTAYLSSFDAAFRAGPAMCKPLDPHTVTETTSLHAMRMLLRTLSFFTDYGPITADGFTFADPNGHPSLNGYTSTVHAGDGDFLTADTLWDLKVSKNPPNKDHTLQLMMYYLMGKASGLPQFSSQHQVGLFNPRLNTVHTLEVASLNQKVIDTIRYDVIGYTR